MPIEQIFEAKDAAPEFLRPLLVEQDGKFVFQAELPHEVQGLKTALDKEREEKQKLAKLAKQFEGIDAAKARELLSAKAQAEEEKAKAQGDWENWKAQMQSQFDQEKHTLTEQISTLERDLAEQMITATATAVIAEAKGIPALLLPHLSARVVVENGKREVRIYDVAGNVRYGKEGRPMTIAERVEEMKSDPIFGRAFEASGNGGSGAPPIQTGPGARNVSWMELSPTERLNAARQAGIKQ